MELKYCDQPWYEMQFEYSTMVRCCCYFAAQEDCWPGDAPPNIPQYWNSDIMKAKRRIIASNHPANTGCAGCQLLKYGENQSVRVIPEGLNPRQLENFRQAADAFEQKLTTVSSLPVKYYINFGLTCNLQCIHCSQEPQRRADNRKLSADLILTQRDYLTRAADIAVIGGEPFAMHESRKFIDAVVSDNEFSDVKLSIFSNGTLLHKYVEKLTSIRKLNLCISLDSMGEHYNRIRLGADWSEIERNILQAKETGQRLGLSWQITIASILMKSSLDGLESFVQWCIHHDVPVHFAPLNSMTPYGFNTDLEDIQNFPALLREIPDWEGKMERSIRMLQERRWTAAANTLALMKSELKESDERLGDIDACVPGKSGSMSSSAENRPIVIRQPRQVGNKIVVEGYADSSVNVHRLADRLCEKPDCTDVAILYIWPKASNASRNYFFGIEYEKTVLR